MWVLEPDPVKHFFELFCWVTAKERRACLRASLSIWRDCHFNETDLALHQQTVSDEWFSLSSSSQKEMRRGFSRTCDLLTPKGIWPESGRYSIFLVSFFFFNPYDRVPGCLMASLSLSQPLRFPFFTNRSDRSEVDKNERTVCFGLQASVSFVLLLSYSCDARFFWWDHH